MAENKEVEVNVEEIENLVEKIALAEETISLANGIAALIVEAVDEIPVLETSGIITVAELIDGKTAVLRDGEATNTPDIGYVARTVIEVGVESSTYTGTDIALTDGKGPAKKAVDGVKACKGDASTEVDSDVTKVVGYLVIMTTTSMNVDDPSKAEKIVVGIAIIVDSVTKTEKQTE